VENTLQPDQVTGRAEPGAPAAAAFDDVYDRYKNDIFRFICYLDPDRAEAEDLFQEVWLRVARHLPEPREGANLKPWLLAIVVNLHRDLLRKKRVRRLFFLAKSRPVSSESGPLEALSPASADPAVMTEQAFLQKKIEQAVARLPEKQRQIFMLREIEGLKQAEIAEILGIPLGTVKSLMHRAVLRLQRELAEFNPRKEKIKCDARILSV
jgi:RNA polymerase sigma-70 factor (ECF subfamily)